MNPWCLVILDFGVCYTDNYLIFRYFSTVSYAKINGCTANNFRPSRPSKCLILGVTRKLDKKLKRMTWDGKITILKNTSFGKIVWLFSSFLPQSKSEAAQSSALEIAQKISAPPPPAPTEVSQHSNNQNNHDWKYLWFFSDTSSASTENTSHSNRTSADIVEGADYSDVEQSVKSHCCEGQSSVPNSAPNSASNSVANSGQNSVQNSPKPQKKHQNLSQFQNLQCKISNTSTKPETMKKVLDRNISNKTEPYHTRNMSPILTTDKLVEQHPITYFRRSSDSSDINQSGLRWDQ